MANERVILADGIAEVPHLQAFDQMIAARMSALEADAVLVYLIDTVSASALPFLADQFDVLGFRGYVLATTDAERRSIIKQAIELKRYMGTVWAVREAMKAVGYADAALIEGVDEGTPEIDWAKFRVEADLGNDKGLDGETATRLARLITEYKNVRSKLLDISFRSSMVDTLPPMFDILNIEFQQPTILEDLGWIGRFYDGTHTYNGSIRYVEGNDSLNIQILPA